jgi:uncharacterized membrane protein YkoI
MKYLILVTLLVTSIITTCSAKVTPNNAVLSAFKQKFPTATNISWGKENAHEFEAEFTENGIKHSANFSEKGEWLETETAIDFNAVPVKVKTSFNAQHNGAKKHEIAKIEKANGNVIFEIEIKVKGKTIDCLYNADGTNVK